MNEYRVNLDMYNGPMDLLLYLIRREEVDIHDIPIARITEQYLAYVEMLKQLDPNLAGEFLVMAATLMEIKTRYLLPVQEAEEGEGDGLTLDPRAELVRQLLEYKAFKDAAGELAEAAERQAMKYPRRPGQAIDDDTEKVIDLEEVQIWDLFDAFQGVLDAIGHLDRDHEVIYDDTPVELHQQDILDRLDRDGPLEFKRIFEGRRSRIEVVGLFIALLELARTKKILLRQETNFGAIRLERNPNPLEEEREEPSNRSHPEADPAPETNPPGREP
jgi:segregation and condensation protein A